MNTQSDLCQNFLNMNMHMLETVSTVFSKGMLAYVLQATSWSGRRLVYSSQLHKTRCMPAFKKIKLNASMSHLYRKG